MGTFSGFWEWNRIKLLLYVKKMEAPRKKGLCRKSGKAFDLKVLDSGCSVGRTQKKASFGLHRVPACGRLQSGGTPGLLTQSILHGEALLSDSVEIA